ncbi:unnamed protein product [Paramecium pentaurelia]|uniref:Uncharacterized protein n=1 Tax=Paramecium pentaurelia TaxID=43138 RepID=A0A8S1UQN2_9CILI|nr:unnamed protein product [Paramecium pentaurelia]
MKKSLTPTSETKYNCSQKIHLLKQKRNKDMLNQAIQELKNPFDPLQVSKAIKFLENQVQRKALLDQIIYIREQKRKKEEFDKMSSMRGILNKVSKRFSIVKNQEVKYTRDHNDFKIMQEERNKFDKLQYENLNIQVNEKRPQLRRLSSLSFLTKETDQIKFQVEQNNDQQTMFVRRQTQRNATLMVNAILKKEIPDSIGRSEKMIGNKKINKLLSQDQVIE